MPEAQGAQAWQPAPEPWWPQPRGPRRPLDAAWTAAHAPPRAAARRPRGPWAWVTLVPAVASGPRGQQVLHASELPRLRTLPGGWGWGASRPAPCRGRSEPPPTAHTLPRANPDLRKRPRGRRGSRPHSVTPREDSVPAPRGSASRRSRTRAWTCSAGRLSGSSSHPSPFRPRSRPEGLAWHVQVGTRFGGHVHRGPAATAASGPGPNLGAPSQAGWTQRPTVLLRGKRPTAGLGQGDDRSSRLRRPAEGPPRGLGTEVWPPGRIGSGKQARDLTLGERRLQGRVLLNGG